MCVLYVSHSLSPQNRALTQKCFHKHGKPAKPLFGCFAASSAVLVQTSSPFFLSCLYLLHQAAVAQNYFCTSNWVFWCSVWDVKITALLVIPRITGWLLFLYIPLCVFLKSWYNNWCSTFPVLIKHISFLPRQSRDENCLRWHCFAVQACGLFLKVIQANFQTFPLGILTNIMFPHFSAIYVANVTWFELF